MRRFGLALLLAATVAHANGRPPLTNGIHFRPGDPHSLYVATTFGLLISHDDGCTFDWVCESNIGYGGPFDPKYRIAQDGTIYATTYNGLRVSRDGGCSFSTVTDNIWIDALDIGPTGEVWLATADSSHPNDILASTDGGHTFQSKGMLSPQIWGKSVAVAPSDPNRVYITGYQVAGTAADGGQMQPTAHFLRSTDDGAHWTESALAGVQVNATPTTIVAAVDPQHPEIVYMISLLANPPDGDRLYRSTDGGTTFTEVLSTTDPIRGVVVRDAQTVLVATQMSGSFRSTDGGVTFQPMTGAPQLACLGQAPDGTLVGCGANWDPDYMAVARSSDGGASWQKMWRFVELHGAVSCPAGTPERDTCDDMQWENLQAQFGATGPSCGAHVGEGMPDAAPTGTPPKKKSGCCAAGSGPAGLGLALLVGLSLWGPRRRRRA
jgi:hypothetical protein